MNKKKTGLILLAVSIALAAAAAWVLLSYHIVDFRLYPKNARHLDLRGQEISVETYTVLQEKLPEAEIRWDVPFQGGLVKDDSKEVTVTTLNAGDVELLDYLKALEVVHGQNCEDYAALVQLQQRRPGVQVEFDMTVGGKIFDESTTRMEIGTITSEELENVPYLTKLEEVVVFGGQELDQLDALKTWCQEQGIAFVLSISGQELPADAKHVELAETTDEDLTLLPLLAELEDVYIQNPKAAPEALLALEETCPNADIRWDVEICGMTFDQDTQEVDLSQVVLEDLSQVEAQMEYLPNAEKLILGLCGIDKESWGNSKAKVAASPIPNEDVSAYRDRVREKYKVAWTVRLGPDIALRTDVDNFMPGHFGMGRLFTDHAYNLRYCEDMICLDLGHMTLREVDFLEFMPHLKYLILAHSEVQYIEPIRHCKELVFLELDWSCIRDYSPLVDCTALEDLNIGKTFCDITPILQMTWLKNLWMINGDPYDANKAFDTLTDTFVQRYGVATVGNGWRNLPNYYAMRDALGMYYMTA